MKFEVIKGNFQPKPSAGEELHESLRYEIAKFAGMMSLPAVIGILRIIENELIREHE